MRVRQPSVVHGRSRPGHACRAILFALACLALPSGCAKSDLETTATAAARLSGTASAYLTVPEDGRFGTKVYTGSGREVAAALAGALSGRFARVEIAADERTPKAALREARAGGFTVLIRSSILRWEDHPAAWSGIPDGARILVEVIDTTTGDAADVAVVEGRGPTRPGGAEGPIAASLQIPLQAYAERLVPLQTAIARGR